MPEIRKTSRSQDLKRSLQPLAAGLSISVIFVAVVSIPLEAASKLDLSAAETTGWILVLYGLPSLIAIALTMRYRQPLLTTGNIFILIFVLLLGGDLRWPELVGATMLAGAIVLGLGLTGLTKRLASLLPAPIVYGLLAGAVVGLVADMFTRLGTATLLVGVTVAAYFLSRAVLGSRVPGLLPALVLGIVIAALSGDTGAFPSPAWPIPTLTMPELTLQGALTATPVMVVFITLQANVPSLVYMRSQGFEPPERTLAVVSGLGTMAGSVFGPMGVSLSLPATALVAGPDAGVHEIRRWATYLGAGAGVLIALLSGFAAEVISFIPAALLDALVGLAVLGISSQALREITRGPLLVGPLVAFVVSLSDLELFGLGRFFWALVFGLTVSLLLEWPEWRALQENEHATRPSRHGTNRR